MQSTSQIWRCHTEEGAGFRKSARLAKASDSSPAFSTEGDGGSGSSLILTPGEILGTRLLLAVGVSTSGETISDEQKEVMKGTLLRNEELRNEETQFSIAKNEEKKKFSINGIGGVGSGGGVDCSTEKWRDWRYIEDDQEREAAKASSKEAMEKQHAKANDGMKDDLCKRLSKHFTAQATKKQKQAEK